VNLQKCQMWPDGPPTKAGDVNESLFHRGCYGAIRDFSSRHSNYIIVVGILTGLALIPDILVSLWLFRVVMPKELSTKTTATKSTFAGLYRWVSVNSDQLMPHSSQWHASTRTLKYLHMTTIRHRPNHVPELKFKQCFMFTKSNKSFTKPCYIQSTEYTLYIGCFYIYTSWVVQCSYSYICASIRFALTYKLYQQETRMCLTLQHAGGIVSITCDKYIITGPQLTMTIQHKIKHTRWKTYTITAAAMFITLQLKLGRVLMERDTLV